MTDHGPPTDEELAAMGRRASGYAFGACMAAQKYHSDVPCLISEVERLREEVERLQWVAK